MPRVATNRRGSLRGYDGRTGGGGMGRRGWGGERDAALRKNADTIEDID